MKPLKQSVLNRGSALAFLTLLAALSRPALSQGIPLKMTLRGTWPDPLPFIVDALDVVGDRAGVATTEGQVVMLDVSDPAGPVRLGQCLAGGRALAVKLSGNHAYVGDYVGNRLNVIDVSNPAQPVRVGRLDLTGPALGINANGSYVYVAVGGSAPILQVIDVGNPAQPASVGWTALTERPLAGIGGTGVQVLDNYVYVLENQYQVTPGQYWLLEVFDVSTAAAPVLVGFYSEPHLAYCLKVADGYAYVGESLGFRVLDVRDPTNPTLAASWGEAGPSAFGTVGAVDVVGDMAYVIHGGLSVFDVRERSNPVLLSDGTPLGGPHLRVGKNAACVSDGTSLVFLDVTDPSHLEWRGEYATMARVEDLAVQGSYGYVIDGGSIVVVDLSDPAGLRVAGRVASGYLATRVSLSGGKAYVVGNHTDLASGGYLEVYDVEDPIRPRRLSHREIGSWNSDVHVLGDFAYVTGVRKDTLGNNHAQLQVFKVQDPANPVRVRSYDTGGVENATALDIANGYAYVTDWTTGLHVLDLSNTANLTRLGLYPAIELVDVEIVGHLAYVSDMNGLLVVDVATPSRPVLLGQYRAVNGPHGRLQLVGQFAFLGCGTWHPGTLRNAKFDIIDVRDPTVPTLVGEYDGVGQGLASCLIGNRLYLGGENGLQMLEVELPLLHLAPPIITGTTVTVSWTGGPGIRLQRTASLTTLNWQNVSGSEGVSQIELPRDAAAAFFRLIQP